MLEGEIMNSRSGRAEILEIAVDIENDVNYDNIKKENYVTNE